LEQIRGNPAKDAVWIQQVDPDQAFPYKQDQQGQDQESIPPPVLWLAKTVSVFFDRFSPDPAYSILKNSKRTYGTAVNPSE
jgi:hypothetical protein